MECSSCSALQRQGPKHPDCVADLLEAEQAEDAVVELHLLAVALVHLIEDLHQLIACLGWVSTCSFMHCQLMERAVPWAANTLVLALCHPVLAFLFLVPL